MRIHARWLTVIAVVLALGFPASLTAAGAQTRNLAKGSASSRASQGGTGGNGASYNGLALTPPMGYNDWYQFTCGINEATVIAQANALVSSGLAAKGYNYMNVDDCWEAPARDPNGNLVADPGKFPHGIAWLADYVHAKGLKFGIYTSAGTNNCSGLPGSYGHYEQDAQTFADWGVDFVKFDWCRGLPSTLQEQLEREMSNALLATGRPIVFSYEYGPDSWSPAVANMWRIGSDENSFAGIMHNFQTDLGLAGYAGPGHWNDLDMLLIGNTNPLYAGWTVQQRQTIMSIWSEMASPLLMGGDLTKLSADDLRILGNSDVIAVDQDPLGKQGRLVAQHGPVDIVAKPLAGGDVALLMVNTSPLSAATGPVSAQAIGLGQADAYALRNLWTGQTTETAGTVAASLPPDGAVMYRVSPGSPVSGPPSPVVNIEDAPLVMTAGAPRDVTVSYTNNGRVAAQDVSLILQSSGSGWSMRAATSSFFPAVVPGKTVSAKWTVIPAASGSSDQQSPIAGPPEVSLTAVAKYRWSSSENAAEADASTPVYTAPPGWQTSLPSLASAFNSVGITDDSHPGGDLYNGDWSYSAQALAAAGLSPGAIVQYGGVSFQWPATAPGTPDNVSGGPWKWVAANGRGNTLGMLGATTRGPIFEDGIAVYTDGTADPYEAQLPNWIVSPGAASTAAAMPYRNHSGGQNNVGVFIDLMKMPVNPDKQVAGVLVPTDPYFHLFSIAVGSSK